MRAQHKSRLGLDAILLEFNAGTDINRDNYRGASRRTANSGLRSRLKSEATAERDNNIFERLIPKDEEDGGQVSIFLQIEWLRDNEIGDTIDNPIVVEDVEDD